MSKKLIWMTLLLVALTIGGLMTTREVSSYHVANPTCNYLLVGPSNITDTGQTTNATFKAVIETTSNQTSSSTFVRLENSFGYTLVTNNTGIMRNGTGETASYEATWLSALDKGTYKVSSGFFFLNNSFYNYSITQANCNNRTFNVVAEGGGIVVIQAQQEIIQEAQEAEEKGNLTLLIAGLVVVIIIAISQMKNKR